MIGIKVDYSICAGTQEFPDREKGSSEKFPIKPKKTVGRETVKFNDVNLSSTCGTISMI